MRYFPKQGFGFELTHIDVAALDEFESSVQELRESGADDAADELEQVRPVGMRVFDFQTIDPEDMAIVMEINSGARFRRFRERNFENLTADEEINLQIFNSYFQKYFLRGMEDQNTR